MAAQLEPGFYRAEPVRAQPGTSGYKRPFAFGESLIVKSLPDDSNIGQISRS
jgi:hypothetical protein